MSTQKPLADFGTLIEGRATCSEKLRFELDLNQAQATEHADDIRLVLGQDPPVVQDADTLKLSYEVFVQYFGDVEAKLNAMRRLLGVPGLTRRVSLDELQHGHSIIVGIVQQIEAIQRQLADGNP
jgi:hypothetical protein